MSFKGMEKDQGKDLGKDLGLSWLEKTWDCPCILDRNPSLGYANTSEKNS